MKREDQIALGILGAGAAFGILGAYSSFEAVRTAMEPSFGADAWLVPVGVDLGIATASAGDLWMASRNERTWWLRFIPHGLALGTIYFNVVSDDRLEGRVAHALLVILWIAFTAAVAHVVKLRAVGRRDRSARMDRIRGLRFLLAPFSSVALLWWMVANEETDYRTALAQRAERRLARAELRDAHGVLAWRWRQSWRDRELYRQGRLKPAAGPVVPGPGPAPTPVPPAPVVPVHSNGDSDVAAIRAIARQLHNNGELTRRSLVKQARAEGHRIGTAKASEIVSEVQA